MKSIAQKLWLGMMALVSLVLLLLWLFQIVFLDSFYTNMRISDIKNESNAIIKELELENLTKFANRLDEFAYNNNLTAELVDLQHSTLYSTGTLGQMPMMRHSIRIDTYNKILAGETLLLPMTHPRFGSKYMLIGMPVIVSGDVKGVLFINLPLIPVKDTVTILKRQLLYITIILLSFSLILSFLLSRTLTKPILDITKVSLEMASGNLSARIKLRQKDEIGRLAETINNLGQKLSKIDQLRRDLIANVSHELRTPISLIKGYAETIRDISGNNPEKREKQIEIIIEESDRLSKIVDDVLNLSQMQAGYINLNVKSFMISETLNKVIKRYEILSDKTGVNIQLNNTHEVTVKADEKRIEQVLYNLINNAFNHSGEGSSITVTSSENKDKVRVEVTDLGEGIPEDEIAYIWDRFYKLDKSGKRKLSGTGLGLAIVKSIFTAHQIDYGVESQVGVGTTFWFELKKCHR